MWIFDAIESYHAKPNNDHVMSSAPKQNYERRLVPKAVTSHPTKDALYAIFNEFVTLHQQHRFAIYPQMSLKWKPHDPQDRRSEVPGFGLGNFTPPGVLPHLSFVAEA